MVAGPLSNPVIDTTRPIPLARHDSQGQQHPSLHNDNTATNPSNGASCNSDYNNSNSMSPFTDNSNSNNNINTIQKAFYKPSIIPEHSSLPSPLSPPLSVSPPSFGSSMADFIGTSRPVNGTLTSTSTLTSTASLPPLHPSASNSSLDGINSNINNTLPTPAAAAAPFIQTSPEAWLAHAAQQRRHLSTGSFSSTTSSTTSSVFPSNNALAHSPVQLEFGESERVQEGGVEQDTEEQEPELNVFMRPSELRASLMARAKRSSVKKQQQQQQHRSESMPFEKGSRLSGQSNQSYNSLSSAYDSRLSARSSTSSSISGWAPRARSSSISSQSSNDSVNLDALIAGESDINEECPLELEEGDDVEWSKDQQQRNLLDQSGSIKDTVIRRNTTADSEVNMMQYDEQDMDEFWDDSEVPPTEEDEEFDETLREFSQLAVKNSVAQIRGLSFGGDKRAGAGSSRFPDGRNPFDLEADYMDTPAGLRTTNRTSNISTYSSTSSSSNRSGVSRLPSTSVSRLPGAPGASGLKAPTMRLAQPGTRSMLAQPKAATSSIAAPRAGIARPSGLQTPKSGLQAPRSGLQAPRSGLQAPRSGLQAPRSGLQAPRTGSSTLAARGSSIATGMAAPGRASVTNTRTTPVDQRKGAAPPRVPSTSGTGLARPGTKNQIAPPSAVRRPSAGSSTTLANRQSLLVAPSTVRNGSSTHVRSLSGNATSPKRTVTSPSLLTSPMRVSSSSSSYMISPTSSQSSTSSLQSLSMGSSARDTVTPLSQRLSNATGNSQLVRPKMTSAAGRSVSMYGSSNLLPTRDSYQHHQHQDQDQEEDYAVLTPPQSPSSSKAGSRVMSGIPRSGIAAPSRLVAPSMSTTRTGRSISPSPLSSGSNSGSQGSLLPRPHTPNSSLPVSRIASGLLSPRAGRH